MALMICPECKNEISDYVDSCPKCGFPIKRINRNRKLGFILAVTLSVLIILGVIFIGIFLSNQLSEAEKAEVRDVTKTIAEIGEVDLYDGDTIASAEKKYNALNDKCKKNVENYDRLVWSREKFDILKAEEVDKEIAAIGDVNKDSEELIEKARIAYNGLSEEQKKSVKKYDDLEKAGMRYDELMAGEVVELIDSIDVSIDNENVDQELDDAEALYDLLTSDQKKLVTNYNLISEYRIKISDLRVSNVEDLIKKIGVVTEDSKDDIRAARNAYKALSDSDKEKVKSENDLLEAEEQFYSIIVSECIDAIDQIGDVSLDSKDAIKNARILYMLLPGEYGKDVLNYEILVSAENKLEVLKQEEEVRKKTLKQGDTFSTKKWEITFRKANISAKILPNDTSGYYLYYYTGDDETYIDLVFKVKNIDVDILKLNDLVKSCSVEYDSKTVYKSCSLFTSSGSSIDKVYDWDGLGALNSITLHAAITMPREIQTSSGSVTVHCTIAGEEKIIVVR